MKAHEARRLALSGERIRPEIRPSARPRAMPARSWLGTRIVEMLREPSGTPGAPASEHPRLTAGGYLALLVVAPALACGIDAAHPLVSAPASDPPGNSSRQRPMPPEMSVDPGCVPGFQLCIGDAVQVQCDTSGRWVERACLAGQRCADGECVGACVDACDWGETRVVDGVGQECALWSQDDGSFVALDPEGSLHDRARLHTGLIRKSHLAAGGVVNTRFASAQLDETVAFEGVGDSAIWTGVYLAAEAWRLHVTGAPAAQRNVAEAVATLHRFFEANGGPGYLSRFAAPLPSGDPIVDALFLPAHHHGDGLHEGTPHFWIGSVSRDQYQGVLLGYAQAYLASEDESVRSIIRADVSELVAELRRERDLDIEVNGLPISVSVRNVVLEPTVPVSISIDSSDPESAAMQGLVEFMPTLFNYVPRSGSGIMLASTLQVGMLVLEGVPGREAELAELRSAYDLAYPQWWDESMRHWAYLNANDSGCYSGYYGINIVFMPAYTLAQLDTNAPRRQQFVAELIRDRLHETVATHNNPWFDLLTAAAAPPGINAGTLADAALSQLGQFTAGADVARDVDNSAYGAHPSCPNLTAAPVLARDRESDEFIWQRHPFKLAVTGDRRRASPGIDFTAPYWLARRHGFAGDDRPRTCQVFR